MPSASRREPDGALKPYLHVRRGLWALVTRALTYDLVDLAEEGSLDGEAWLGLWAGGVFHPSHRLPREDPLDDFLARAATGLSPIRRDPTIRRRTRAGTTASTRTARH